MGWNSWDCYGCSVTEDEVRANADAMASRLRRFGWRYVVVDMQWASYNPDPLDYHVVSSLNMDEYGRLLPAETRFPSAARGAGFKPLADALHRRGLKLGIHVMRGIPRLAVERNLPVLGTDVTARDIANTDSICQWCDDMYGLDMSRPGAQAYYDSLAALYAAWGVDYVKADDMTFPPYHAAEISGFAQALRTSGRAIALSLSPGPLAPDEGAHAAAHAHLWRTSADFWDEWEALERHFALAKIWAPLAGPDHWPDADMLPLGRIGVRAERPPDRSARFTHDEQITMMSLWSIARSPLMFGGDLPSCDAFTLSLLTNPEVLAINQHSVGSREVWRDGHQVLWMARTPAGDGLSLGLFNLDGDRPTTITVRLAEVGADGVEYRARDLWARRDHAARVAGSFAATIKPHGAGLYRLTPARRRARLFTTLRDPRALIAAKAISRLDAVAAPAHRFALAPRANRRAGPTVSLEARPANAAPANAAPGTTEGPNLARFTLRTGAHASAADGMCVMELSSFLADEPFSDHPACVSPLIAVFLRTWNDALDDERRQQLTPYAWRVLGTASDAATELRRAHMVLDWLVRVYAPSRLRLAGMFAHAAALEALAELRDGSSVAAALAPLRAARDATQLAVRPSVWEMASDPTVDDAWVVACAAAADGIADAGRDAIGDQGCIVPLSPALAAALAALQAVGPFADATLADATLADATLAAQEVTESASRIVLTPAAREAAAAHLAHGWEAAARAAREAARALLQTTVEESRASAFAVLEQMIATTNASEPPNRAAG
jgi:hypothetical protein